jgi:ATP-dependent RNA helicase DOB1
MLYRGSEITREMAWVIFDEVHYMRDKERGVVWEETIILLPSTVKYVFLSATIPNARDFAEWICTIKKQPCNVVYTDFRPVPLEHYLHPSGTNNLHLVVDKTGKFREDNFLEAISKMDEDNDLEKLFESKGKKVKRSTEQSELRSVINYIVSKNYEPCLVFAFSKADCENYARIVSKCEYTTEEERENIEKIYMAAIESLSEEDQELPQNPKTPKPQNPFLQPVC